LLAQLKSQFVFPELDLTIPECFIGLELSLFSSASALLVSTVLSTRVLVGLVPLPPEDVMLVVVPAPTSSNSEVLYCWSICCSNRSGDTQITYDVQSLSIVVLMELVSTVIKTVFVRAE
jgi:hypothetical protein